MSLTVGTVSRATQEDREMVMIDLIMICPHFAYCIMSGKHFRAKLKLGIYSTLGTEIELLIGFEM